MPRPVEPLPRGYFLSGLVSVAISKRLIRKFVVWTIERRWLCILEELTNVFTSEQMWL